MSILKGILHHWNKKNNAYDTIHPETESAQVTDWDSGIGATLAKTTLGSLISTLSSDSFAAKVVKLVLDATGMKYSMGTNGYICFGSLFGGLIIQWANVTAKTTPTEISLPLAATYLKSVGGIQNGPITGITFSVYYSDSKLWAVSSNSDPGANINVIVICVKA